MGAVIESAIETERQREANAFQAGARAARSDLQVSMEQEARRQAQESEWKAQKDHMAEAQQRQDSSHRQSMTNPFAAAPQSSNTPVTAGDDPAREAMSFAIAARRQKQLAMDELQECRRRNGVKPGIDDEKHCSTEVVAVRKHTGQQQSWTEESIRRSRERREATETQERQRQTAVEQASQVRSSLGTENDDSGIEMRNPFSMARGAYREAKQNASDKWEQVKKSGQEMADQVNPFSAVRGITTR